MFASRSSALIAMLLAGILLAMLLPERLLVWTLPLFVALPLLAAGGAGTLIAGLAAGVLFALAWQGWVLDQRPDMTAGTDRVVTGTVVDLPETERGRQRFRLRVHAMEPAIGPQPRHIRVSIHDRGMRVRAGEKWRMRLRIQRPRGFMNPVGFDYERWLATRHVDATGYRIDPHTARRLAPPQGLHHRRAALSGRIADMAGDSQGAAVLRGLITGDRRAFSDATWETLRATGTTHLVAISGLHIGLVAGLGLLGGRLLWRGAPLPGPRHFTATVAGAVAAAGYAALAGFSIPTQRALIMFGVVAMASLLARRVSPSRGLLVAALLVLTLDPAAALAPGFWLSFTAVALILCLARTGTESMIGGLIRIQVGLTLGLAPLTAAFFGGWSPGGLIANLLVIPVFSMLIVPAALIGAALTPIAPVPAQWLLTALARAIDGLLSLGRGLVDLGLDFQTVAPPTLAVMMAALTAVSLYLLPAGTPGRWLMAPLLVPLLLGKTEVPAPGKASITWLEVGAGSAAVIQTQSTVTVVDTGPGWSGGRSAADLTLIPYLQERGIDTIDHLVITRDDSAHRGGSIALREQFSLGRVHAPPGFGAVSFAASCRSPREWTADGVRFRFISPGYGSPAPGGASYCLLSVETDGGRILFAGGLRESDQGFLHHRAPLAADIMEVPHHGRAPEITERLMNLANSAHGIISAGYPRQDDDQSLNTMTALQCRGATVHHLGLKGAIQAQLTPEGFAIQRGERFRRARLLNAGSRRPDFRPDPNIPYDPASLGMPTATREKDSC